MDSGRGTICRPRRRRLGAEYLVLVYTSQLWSAVSVSEMATFLPAQTESTPASQRVDRRFFFRANVHRLPSEAHHFQMADEWPQNTRRGQQRMSDHGLVQRRHLALVDYSFHRQSLQLMLRFSFEHRLVGMTGVSSRLVEGREHLRCLFLRMREVSDSAMRFRAVFHDRTGKLGGRCCGASFRCDSSIDRDAPWSNGQ